MQSDDNRPVPLPRPWRWIGANPVRSRDLGTDFDYLGFHRDLSRIANNILDHSVCVSLLSDLAPLAGSGDDIALRLRNTAFKSLRNELIPLARMIAAARSMSRGGTYRVLARPTLGQTLAVLTQGIDPGVIAGTWVSTVGGLSHCFWKLAVKATAALTRRLRRDGRIAAASTSELKDATARDGKSRPEDTPPVDAEVLIFAHHGIGYGDLYEAGYYFRDEIDHPLNRKRVLILEYLSRPMMPGGQMFISARRTPGESFTLIREGLSRTWLASGGPMRFFLALPILRAINVIRGYEQSLKAFPNALVAIIHFDIQCPPELVIAAQNLGLSCIALQERSNALCVPTQPLILDHYFVYGAAFRRIAQRNPNVCIRQYHEIGPIRADWITPRSVEPGPKLVLVLDAFSWSLDSAPDLLKANSWENNALFLDRIIRLSEHFPEHRFLIRGKDANWMEMDYFKDTVARITKRDNLKVDQTYSLQRRSYDLVNEADLIVARHSSLGDEAMAKGVPTVFYEETVNGTSVVSNFSTYDDYPLYAHNFTELCHKTSKIISDGRLTDSEAFKQMRRNLYSSHLVGTAAARFHEKVGHILQERRTRRRTVEAAA